MTTQQLALFGGKPAFETPLHVGAPSVGNRDRLMERINGVLDRRWFTNDGPLVRELEERIAVQLGVRNCVAVCNGTVGLELAVRALGLHGEVIVPSMTFVATAHALQWQQIRPVFADIDPRTHNISVDSVESLISPATTGIIGVHLWGRPCDTEGLAMLARSRGLRLMFDAAHAFLVSHRGRWVGGFGDLEVFSFHATKFFNTFEGGAITTDDDELADRLRLMRNFGFAGYDHVVYIGTNGKMNEVSAAMGLSLFDELDSLVAANQHKHDRYAGMLAAIPGLSTVKYPDAEHSNYQYVVLEVDAAEAGLSRNELLEVLWRENIHARRYFYPGCHRMEPYRTLYPDAAASVAHTEALLERVLALPAGSAVDDAAIDRIVAVIRTALQYAPQVAARLRTGPALPTYGKRD